MKKNSRVIIACIVLMLLLGLYYTWSVFSNALISKSQWTYSEANLPFTFSMLSYSVAIFLFGFYYEKNGPKKTVLIAASMMFAGLFISGIFFTRWAVAIGYGILYGGGSAGCYTTAISTLMKWVPDKKRSLYSGLATGAYGIAGVYTALIINALVEGGGAAFAFKTLALTIIPLILVTVCFISLPEEEKKTGTMNRDTEDIPLKAAIKEKTFFYITLSYMFGCAGGNAIIGNISNIAVKQCSIENGFMFVSIMSACNCIGRLAGGFLGGIFPKKNVLGLAMAVDVVSLLLFRFYNVVPLLIIGTFVTGFAFGCEMSLIPPFITDYYGVKYYSEIYGAIIFTSCISSFIGPQLAGKLTDLSGSFNTAYLLCAAYLLIGFICIEMLPKKVILNKKEN